MQISILLAQQIAQLFLILSWAMLWSKQGC